MQDFLNLLQNQNKTNKNKQKKTLKFLDYMSVSHAQPTKQKAEVTRITAFIVCLKLDSM